MKIIPAILLVLTATIPASHADSPGKFLAKIDSYRVCDFREYPYSIWEKVCWKFPVIGVTEVKGEYVVAGNYLMDKKYVSQEKKQFPLKAFNTLIAKFNPDKKFLKWRMPGKISVIVLMYDKDKNYLGSIQIDTNYDAFSIHAGKGYYFRFGDGVKDKNVSTIINALVK